MGSGTETGSAADYIEFKEFRVFLSYLRQYFEYWVMFNRIDTSHHRIEFKEFKVALEELKKWGVEVDNARAAWMELDKDGRGLILFDEFADWGIMKNLDLDD